MHREFLITLRRILGKQVARMQLALVVCWQIHCTNRTSCWAPRVFCGAQVWPAVSAASCAAPAGSLPPHLSLAVPAALCRMGASAWGRISCEKDTVSTDNVTSSWPRPRVLFGERFGDLGDVAVTQ